MTRKTILLLAYSVSPTRGSEYSVAWNYIREMSQDHDLIVLYGLAGDHMGDLEEVAQSQVCQNLPHVDWVPIRPNWLATLLNTPNRNGFMVYSFYLAYRVWHKQSYAIALELLKTRHIDLIHHLCPIGYREPGYLRKLQKAFIWGPVGGIDNRSVKLVLEKSWVAAIKVFLRNTINTLQFRFSPRVKHALQRADLLFSSTTRVQAHIRNAYKIDSIVMPENAITDEMLSRQRVVSAGSDDTLKLIWVGRIDEAKALDILLNALAPLKAKRWHLTVVGDGPSRGACAELALELGIDEKINWTGKLPRHEVDMHYKNTHLNVITSLFEGNPTVIWEAMSFGIPTLTLDHFGMHDTVCEKCGHKVSTHGSLSAVVDGVTSKIAQLIDHPEQIEHLSKGVHQCAKQYTWSQRRLDWSLHYDTAIQNWKSSQKDH